MKVNLNPFKFYLKIFKLNPFFLLDKKDILAILLKHDIKFFDIDIKNKTIVDLIYNKRQSFLYHFIDKCSTEWVLILKLIILNTIK